MPYRYLALFACYADSMPTPQLTREEAVNIAKEAARIEGFGIQDYDIGEGQCDYFCNGYYWFIFFHHEPPATPHDGFVVMVDDRAKYWFDLVSTLSQDTAFTNSGLLPEDVQAICLLMVKGPISPYVLNEFSNDPTRTTRVSSSDAAISDTRILSVVVEPGGDTVYIKTGEVRGLLAGRGDYFTFVRKLGRWYRILHKFWIS